MKSNVDKLRTITVRQENGRHLSKADHVKN